MSCLVRKVSCIKHYLFCSFSCRAPSPESRIRMFLQGKQGCFSLLCHALFSADEECPQPSLGGILGVSCCSLPTWFITIHGNWDPSMHECGYISQSWVLPQSPQHPPMPPALCILLYPEHHLLKVPSEHSPARYLRVTVLCIQEAPVGALYSQIVGGTGLGFSHIENRAFCFPVVSIFSPGFPSCLLLRMAWLRCKHMSQVVTN